MKIFNVILLVSAILATLLFSGCNKRATDDLPNILWIVSEDNSPFLGCYNDRLAITPNLDRLASEGFLYTHAYANAPVCAPARNTIISGVYACSNGNQHMRSYYPLASGVHMYTKFLREKGYYCTNNSKEDYNTIKEEGIWDESSNKAHYSNRKKGQPFFHIKNLGTSHESSIHKSTPTEELTHKPGQMILPPYHPDTEEMRHDWAQYYDKIWEMDIEVGNILAELERDGLSENTIVFYYSDHGGVLGRSKRYVYESGTHVPFIIRIPEKYKKLYPASKRGSKINRLISFVDLAPTMMSITGISIPEYLQGNAFLGKQKSEDPDYAYMFRGRMDEWYDMCRSVRDHKYRYIKNYMPHRIYGQRVAYLWRAPSMPSWEQAYLSGLCNETQGIFWNTKPSEELYDTENDPWEVHNLADDPEYYAVLERMRKANVEWMLRIKDAGFIPEADLIRRTEGTTSYEYLRSGKVPLKEIIMAAETASMGKKENIGILQDYLKNNDSAIRYWGATGLLILKDEAWSARNDLITVLNDKSPDVIITAAEALYHLGEKKIAENTLLKMLDHHEDKVRCHALNTIVYLDLDGQKIKEAVKRLNEENKEGYAIRIVKWLTEKWNLENT